MIKKVLKLSVCMVNPKDLTGYLQIIILGQHTMDQINKAATSAESYDTLVLGGALPSVSIAEILTALYMVQ